MATINPPGRGRNLRCASLLATTLCAGVLSSGCYSYRLATHALPSTEIGPAQSIPAYNLFWGILARPQVIHTPNCDSLGLNGVAEVRVKTSFGNALVTVLTLGIYSPVRVEWKCSKPCPPTSPGEL